MYLGIDIGSLYISLVFLDENNNIIWKAYEQHRGNPLKILQKKLKELQASHAEIKGYAKTGTGAKKIAGIGEFIDPVVAQLDGVRISLEGIHNIIVIGAGSFTLIRTNEDGEYLKHTSNSACASGTGAFLDQQAIRLKFLPEELHIKAASAKNCPPVATRCAVFAKSDIIHLQQSGFMPEDIAAGLCQGLGRSAIDQLLQGRTISGKTVMVGGVAKNSEVVKAVEKRIGMSVAVPQYPELVGAVGAALYAKKHQNADEICLDDINVFENKRKKARRDPLKLRYSEYPDFKYHDFYIDENETETAQVVPLKKKNYSVVLGIDIGSTSTKCTLVNSKKEMLAIYYTPTRGNPIKAVKNLFKAIIKTEEKTGALFDVLGVGTTGSGRKFIKKIINADIECDEITAHAGAATFIDPNVDTIIELGGQDAKFTQLQDGVVYNSVMNYVCAAGTGSFIEEQAKKLGISVWDYADFVMGEEAPFTSDRCTVFMERDLEGLVTSGCSKKEVAASVLFSVRDNYLNKVVGGLHIGKHVYFQGATARNKALVAAFEDEIGRPIAVSPYCHVTGALGMSLMLLDKKIEKSNFRGFSFAWEKTTTESDECLYCSNQCSITVVTTGDERVNWGYKCGRDDDATLPVNKKLPEYELFKIRAKLQHSIGKNEIKNKRGVVAAPRSLTFFGYAPFWRAFLAELGYELRFSPVSTGESVVAGERVKTAEFCAPIVLSLGHVNSTFEMDADFCLFPYMIRECKPEGFSNAHFCPHIQSFPSLVKTLFPEIDKERLLSPVLDLDLQERSTVKTLLKDLGGKLGVKHAEVKSALKAGKLALEEFYEKCQEAGKKRMDALKKEGKMGVVIVGRPYNVNDPILSLNLPKKIAEKNIVVFPMEFVSERLDRTASGWPNMYWAYGQRILSTANLICDTPELFGVFFTSFSCGPDSYLLSFFKHLMSGQKKPHLTLQLDAHGADAGYLTRIEASIEAFKAWKDENIPHEAPHSVNRVFNKKRTVFVPAMDSIISHLFAAAFKRFGYSSVVLEENEETLSSGLKHCSGGECMPCPSTLGGFLHAIKEQGVKPENAALFMPTTDGPCRFGQYNVLHSLALKKLGMEGVSILSPSSDNAYQGLLPPLRKLMWDAIVIGDIMHKVVNKIRPYEAESGEMDRVLGYYRRELQTHLAMEKHSDLPGVFKAFIDDSASIKTIKCARKPLIGVVGEIYVRNSDFSNNNVIREIEKLGGEVVRTSTAEWILYTSFLHKYFTKGTWKLKKRLDAYVTDKFFHGREKLFTDIAMDVIHDRLDPHIDKVVELGSKFVPHEYQTEAILTLGRAITMIEDEKVDAVLNLSPTFCMPGVFTSSMFSGIEEHYGVPIICNFYDGSGDPNVSLIPHLHYLQERLKEQMPKIRDRAKSAHAE